MKWFSKVNDYYLIAKPTARCDQCSCHLFFLLLCLVMFFTSVTIARPVFAANQVPGRNFKPAELAYINKAINFLEDMGEATIANNVKNLLDKDTDDVEGDPPKKIKALRADDSLTVTAKTVAYDYRDGSTGVVIRFNKDFLVDGGKFGDILMLAEKLLHEKVHEPQHLVDQAEKILGESAWGWKKCTDNHWTELEALYNEIQAVLRWKDKFESDSELVKKYHLAHCADPDNCTDPDWFRKQLLARVKKLAQHIADKKYEKNNLLIDFYNEILSHFDGDNWNWTQDKLKEEVQKRLNAAKQHLPGLVERFDERKKQESEQTLPPDQGSHMDLQHQYEYRGQSLSYLASLKVSAGALSGWIPASITHIDDSFVQPWLYMQPVSPVYLVSPYPLGFHRDLPARLTITCHEDVSLELVDVYWLDISSSTWERIDTGRSLDLGNKRISVLINHASIFVAMEGAGGAVGVGGTADLADKLSLLSPYVMLTSILVAAVVTLVYVKRKKRKQN